MISAKARSAVSTRGKINRVEGVFLGAKISYTSTFPLASVDLANFTSTSLQSTLHTDLDAGQAVEYGAI